MLFAWRDLDRLASTATLSTLQLYSIWIQKNKCKQELDFEQHHLTALSINWRVSQTMKSTLS